jgi:myo-inositol catabolism protein IolC
LPLPVVQILCVEGGWHKFCVWHEGAWRKFCVWCEDAWGHERERVVLGVNQSEHARGRSFDQASVGDCAGGKAGA